jgi:serine/threonine protein kinase
VVAQNPDNGTDVVFCRVHDMSLTQVRETFFADDNEWSDTLSQTVTPLARSWKPPHHFFLLPTPLTVSSFISADMILQSLEYLESKRALNRDVSPSNFLFSLGSFYAAPVFEMWDFGMTLLLPNDVSDIVSANMIGTEHFIAPEVVAQRRYNFKSPVYSCGAILYWWLTQQAVPRSLNDLDLRRCPAPLRPVLTEMLARDPASRLSASAALAQLPTMADPVRMFADGVVPAVMAYKNQRGLAVDRTWTFSPFDPTTSGPRVGPSVPDQGISNSTHAIQTDANKLVVPGADGRGSLRVRGASGAQPALQPPRFLPSSFSAAIAEVVQQAQPRPPASSAGPFGSFLGTDPWISSDKTDSRPHQNSPDKALRAPASRGGFGSFDAQTVLPDRPFGAPGGVGSGDVARSDGRGRSPFPSGAAGSGGFGQLVGVGPGQQFEAPRGFGIGSGVGTGVVPFGRGGRARRVSSNMPAPYPASSPESPSNTTEKAAHTIKVGSSTFNVDWSRDALKKALQSNQNDSVVAWDQMVPKVLNLKRVVDIIESFVTSRKHPFTIEQGKKLVEPIISAFVLKRESQTETGTFSSVSKHTLRKDLESVGIRGIPASLLADVVDALNDLFPSAIDQEAIAIAINS